MFGMKNVKPNGNHSSIHPNTTTNAKWKTDEINLGKKFNINKSTARIERPEKNERFERTLLQCPFQRK